MEKFILTLGIGVFRTLYWLVVISVVIGSIVSKDANESWWSTIFVVGFFITIAHFLFLKPSRVLLKLRDEGENVTQKRPTVSKLTQEPERYKQSYTSQNEVHSYQQKYPRYQSSSRPSGKPGKWYRKGEVVKVHGYEFDAGMVYVGESLPASGG